MSKTKLRVLLLTLTFVGLAGVGAAYEVGSTCDIEESCGPNCCGSGSGDTAIALVEPRCNGTGYECPVYCSNARDLYVEAQGRVSVDLGNCDERDLFVCEAFIDYDSGDPVPNCSQCYELNDVDAGNTDLDPFLCSGAYLAVGHAYYYQLRVNDWTGKTGACTSCTCTPDASCTNCAQVEMGTAISCEFLWFP